MAAEPRADRDPIVLTEAELSIAANARVSSAAWAKVWMPALLGGRSESNLRLAPISHSGQLFGLIVADRAHKAESLAVEADATLEEVAREVGMEGGLGFEVTDDGSGFDSQGAEDGSGLTNMRDRLGAVGGTLKIESAVGSCTTVRGCVPLSQSGAGSGTGIDLRRSPKRIDLGPGQRPIQLSEH